ncbi:hypothetical protein ACIBBD_04915 [Streptomyces sp. NPDC051315]|uniref:hypothetical protein n=1 Tax=Streptomyces sp. NPDC051315 TaxID=3365650 RepID=UPI0037AF36A7
MPYGVVVTVGPPAVSAGSGGLPARTDEVVDTLTAGGTPVGAAVLNTGREFS